MSNKVELGLEIAGLEREIEKLRGEVAQRIALLKANQLFIDDLQSEIARLKAEIVPKKENPESNSLPSDAQQFGSDLWSGLYGN